MSLLTEDIGMECAGLSLWVEGEGRGRGRDGQGKTEEDGSMQEYNLCTKQLHSQIFPPPRVW